jgi:hypothetical protein
MLFLQGTRDALAMLDQLEPLCQELGARASLRLFEGRRSSFHVPAKAAAPMPRSWRKCWTRWQPGRKTAAGR